jgi:hypothetical protein
MTPHASPVDALMAHDELCASKARYLGGGVMKYDRCNCSRDERIREALQTAYPDMAAVLDEWLQASMTWRSVAKNISSLDRFMPLHVASQRMYDAGKMLATAASGLAQLGNPVGLSEGKGT